MRHEDTVLKFDSVLALDLRDIFYTIKHYLVGISKLKYSLHSLESYHVMHTASFKPNSNYIGTT